MSVCRRAWSVGGGLCRATGAAYRGPHYRATGAACRGLRGSAALLRDTGETPKNSFLAEQFSKVDKKLQSLNPSTILNPFKIEGRAPPQHADVVIIGGGVMGWSVAYWLKKLQDQYTTYKVLVVERDPTYSQASTVLSAGGIRQQFSRPENIQMSLFGAEFLRNINEYLGVYGEEPIDVQFNPSGYLFVASEKGAPVLVENFLIQRELGAQVTLLSPEQLKKKFPWVNTEGVAAATYGLENEGWFDPWRFLYAFRQKAISMGVQVYQGNVSGFKTDKHEMVLENGRRIYMTTIKDVKVSLPNSVETYNVECNAVINAAGAWSAKVAEMAGVGKGNPDVPEQARLPVEPRKRYVYVFNSPNGPGMNCPMLIDSSGAYFRREGFGGNYIGGLSPPEEEEPDISNLDVDLNYFDEKVWPLLAHRVPAFESLKVKSAWAGYYDYNTYDQNGVIGTHPLVHNMYFACGFSGHGLQQAPAVGRAIAELMTAGHFQALNLDAFGFERFIRDEPIVESNIV